ncbi:pre-peptidase C-terminal domain-containing protein, partial [Acidisoma cellulosilytica]
STWTGLPAVATAAAADNAGNTIAAANTTSLAALTTLAKTVAGWVSSADTDDYYKFTLSSLSTVAFRLSGLNASDDAYLTLYNAAGTAIGSSALGTKLDPASLVQNLASGTYYVDVSDVYGTGTGYSLLATPTTLPNAAGTTLAAATTLGSLTTAAVSQSDWVGNAAPDDYYSFTLNAASAVSLNLTGLNLYGTVTLLDGAGNQISAVSYPGQTLTELATNLNAGTYYIHVNDTTDTTYTVAASATALPAAGGSSLASAQNLGTLGTVSTT